MITSLYHYQKTIDHIQENSTSLDLPFHGFQHLMDVRYAAAMAMNFMWFEQRDREIVELAAMFHDVDHQQKPDTELDSWWRSNIDYAIEAFDNFVRIYPIDEQASALVRVLIRLTTFPYNLNQTMYDDLERLSTKEVLMVDLLREADLLHSLIFYDSKQVAQSFGEERGIISLEETIKMQLGFIPNLKQITWYPKTNWWNTDVRYLCSQSDTMT